MKMFETIGMVLILLGLMLPLGGWSLKYEAYNQEVDTVEDLQARDRKMGFAEYLIKWCQILVLAGIGFILFDRLKIPKS